MRKYKRVIFRVFPFNILSYPLLLNVWEQHNIDQHFDILLSKEEITPQKGDILIYSFMTVHAPVIHAEILRINQKDILIVGGGPHVNGEQELAFLMGFDILMIGWGERNFLEFGFDLLRDRVSKEPRVYQHQPEKSDFEQYLPFSSYQHSIPPLELMRGCGNKCKYCQTGRHDPVYREQISINKYYDLLLSLGKGRVNFICSSPLNYEFISRVLIQAKRREFDFIEFGIFPSELHPRAVTPELMKLLENTVANRSVTLGIQSGSQQRLSELNRHYSIDWIGDLVYLINRHKFKVNLDFIIGFPRETSDERDITLNFAQWLKKKYQVRIQLHYFFPVSGSTYAFEFSSFLSNREKSKILDLTRNSITSKGWIQNEKDTRSYFNWLRKHFPDYYARYH